MQNDLDISSLTTIESIITTIAGDNGVSVDAGALSTVANYDQRCVLTILIRVNIPTDVSASTLEEIQEYTKAILKGADELRTSSFNVRWFSFRD